jgi:hypothetical protein
LGSTQKCLPFGLTFLDPGFSFEAGKAKQPKAFQHLDDITDTDTKALRFYKDFLIFFKTLKLCQNQEVLILTYLLGFFSDLTVLFILLAVF